MEQLITRQEAARLLNLSLATIDRMIRAGDIKAVRIGRRILFQPAEIERRVKQWAKN